MEDSGNYELHMAVLQNKEVSAEIIDSYLDSLGEKELENLVKKAQKSLKRFPQYFCFHYYNNFRQRDKYLHTGYLFYIMKPDELSYEEWIEYQKKTGGTFKEV